MLGLTFSSSLSPCSCGKVVSDRIFLCGTIPPVLTSRPRWSRFRWTGNSAPVPCRTFPLQFLRFASGQFRRATLWREPRCVSTSLLLCPCFLMAFLCFEEILVCHSQRIWTTRSSRSGIRSLSWKRSGGSVGTCSGSESRGSTRSCRYEVGRATVGQF